MTSTMAASVNEIEEFLDGPLVTWLATCLNLPERINDYSSLCDGTLIHKVLLQIDPEPTYVVSAILIDQNSPSAVLTRLQNFSNIVNNIKNLYEDELEQIIVQLPDVLEMSTRTNSPASLKQMNLLLLLLLGCAVQCPCKEIFITRIKELSLDIQHQIVNCIKQITDDQSLVITPDVAAQMSDKTLTTIKLLTQQRNVFNEQLVKSSIGALIEQNDSSVTSGGNTNNNGVESNHMAVELADWKSRLRKMRQELEEKSEALLECKEDLEYTKTILAKIRIENNELMTEARRAKAYRDELDALREHAERADRLELDAQRYRERLADMDFYRQRIDELREDNKNLMETREVLEKQLGKLRQRFENTPRLEAELLSKEQDINVLVLERDAAHDKIKELIDENTQLQLITKNQSSVSLLDDEFETSDHLETSLSEQLTNNAQARALKLELENKRLQSLVENLKDSSFNDSYNQILELDKDKKKFMIKCEQQTDNYNKLLKQNGELERAHKQLLEDNMTLKNDFETFKETNARVINEMNVERGKVMEAEKMIECLKEDNLSANGKLDALKVRFDEVEKSLREALDTNEVLTGKNAKLDVDLSEMERALTCLRKDNAQMHKELARVKDLLESKTYELDQQLSVNDQQKSLITTHTSNIAALTVQLQKLQDVTHQLHETESQLKIVNETVQTLQTDLIAQKLTSDKLRAICDKIGLNHAEINDVTDECLFKFLLRNDDLIEAVKMHIIERESNESVDSIDEGSLKMKDEEHARQLNELRELTTKREVEISTLTSRVNSLQAQNTAVQLANRQLVAEKEALEKQQDTHMKLHNRLCNDQKTMETIHNQLTAEYDALKIERDQLRTSVRDTKNDLRNVQERLALLERTIRGLELEKQSLQNDSKNLLRLRAEHSKLKDDFRTLYDANERIKTDYRALQESNKNVRLEVGKLNLDITHLREELTTSHVENNYRQKCETLLAMFVHVDADRKALMGHAAQLLTQYHSLLKHTLDGEVSHNAEKQMLNERMHELLRQKDRLEDKIMEHYRKLDNIPKKKGFGSNFVRRVRKAGSDFINKVPGGHRRSWQEDSYMSQPELNQLPSSTGSGSGDNDESIGNDSDLDDTNQLLTNAPLMRNRNKTKNSLENIQRRASLGSIGTRRAVYLNEQEPTQAVPATSGNDDGTAAPSLLVYNRINTFVNSKEGENDVSATDGLVAQTQEQRVSEEKSRWYEYGCV